jgi:hypothetical protein
MKTGHCGEKLPGRAFDGSPPALMPRRLTLDKPVVENLQRLCRVWAADVAKTAAPPPANEPLPRCTKAFL